MIRSSAALCLLALAVACSGGDKGDDTSSTSTGVECVDGVGVLSGTYTQDLTLTPDCDWVLSGGVFIGDDVEETVLTIEPGTTVYGESGSLSFLSISRGSKIMAEGTADAPIVFTSSLEDGARSRGDWGGLVINGRAPVNVCDEGTELCESFGEGSTGWYGGDDPSDDSGVLQYVRVEFAGVLIDTENEMNGIAFQGVGSGTTVEYLQVHMNADDGMEFFGGTVTWKHLIVSGVGDDTLDWTDGWQGKGQFFCSVQASDAGDNGIEADNNGENNEATPRSNPTISNVSLVGASGSSSADLGMLLREGTAASLSNVLVTGYDDEGCLDVDHDATWALASSGDLSITHSLLDCVTSFVEEDGEGSVEDWFLGQTGNSVGDPALTSTAVTAPDWRPTSGSPALGAGSAPSDSFFESADFIGCMGADDWADGWTSFPAN